MDNKEKISGNGFGGRFQPNSPPRYNERQIGTKLLEIE